VFNFGALHLDLTVYHMVATNMIGALHLCLSDSRKKRPEFLCPYVPIVVKKNRAEGPNNQCKSAQSVNTSPGLVEATPEIQMNKNSK
jgi:hypothetical protein